MTYNYSPTQNNGRITSAVDGVTGESTSYSYDALNRLVGASNSLWNGSYGYDGFGNLTSKTGSGGSPNSFPSMTASYNAENQVTANTYDADGNPTVDSAYWYWYTVENKLSTRESQSWPYAKTFYGNDPSGRRVMKETNPDPNNYEGQNNPLWEFYFYTINGQKLVTIDCNNANAQYQPNCWPVGENVYFGKRLLVSNGVYVVTDRLGTVRANTQGESFAYYPFGEERTSTVNGRDKFATYFRDGVRMDYAQQRYYNGGLGRFWTVDPGGLSTVHSGNPTSWNLYAYVNGDPINSGDSTGLGDNDPGTSAATAPAGCAFDSDGDLVCSGEGDNGDDGDTDSGGDTASDSSNSNTGCAADTCITVTGTVALVPVVAAPPTTELIPTFLDNAFDWLLTGVTKVIGVGGVILGTPTSFGCETLSACPGAPAKPWAPIQNNSSKWTCTALCQVVNYSTQNTTWGQPATATGSDQTLACQAAKAAASQLSPPGSYSRHCKCTSCVQR